MEYKGNGRVTQKGESSRDQEEEVKPERGKGRQEAGTPECVRKRERPEVAGTGRQGGEKGREEARWAGEGRERSETEERGEEETEERRKNREGREEGRGDRH